MMGFRTSASSGTGFVAWEGSPDDDAAHQTILNWLLGSQAAVFLGQTTCVSNRVKGNLGEFIAHRIGETYVFSNKVICDSANAAEPLSDISRPDIDIVWLYFAQSDANDWAALQEVKTTGQSSLSLADRLIDDYDKLFGENLRLTLQTRLGVLKNRLDQQGRRHLSSRVTALGGPSPDGARGICLIPTLIHDSAYDASSKMAAVRQALIGRGWSSNAVECWSVGLDDINDRLTRLARGQK